MPATGYGFLLSEPKYKDVHKTRCLNNCLHAIGKPVIILVFIPSPFKRLRTNITLLRYNFLTDKLSSGDMVFGNLNAHYIKLYIFNYDLVEYLTAIPLKGDSSTGAGFCARNIFLAYLLKAPLFSLGTISCLINLVRSLMS